MKFATITIGSILKIAAPGIPPFFEAGDLVKVIGLVEHRDQLRGVKCQLWNGRHHDFTDADGAVYHYGLLEDKAKVHAIVQRHLVGGKPVAEYLIKSA